MSFDLIEYVERRARLAGSAILDRSNPYNLAIDALEARFHAVGEPFLNFANYDYLGLSRDSRVIEASRQALERFGIGVGGSRMVGGDRSIHRAFEERVAAFVGQEDALATVSGYGLNVSLLGHLMSSSDLILIDELSHNSIITGTGLTRATTMAFRHNDLDHLEYLLGRYRAQHKRALIVVEGLYSMDGDMPDMAHLIDIKTRTGAWLMVDEAHSIGVVGKTGRGVCEHFGVDPEAVEFTVGTLSKALGSCGGFVCSKAPVVHWLRHTLPGFVYSVGLSPPVIAASTEALSILRDEPERVERLARNSRLASAQAKALGLRTGRSMGMAILPILFSSRETAIEASMRLLEQGIYVPPIIQQAVSSEGPRLRLFLSANHSQGDLERVLDAVAAQARRLGELGDVNDAVIPLRPRQALHG